MNTIVTNGSYNQQNRFRTVSEKYNVITPAVVGEIMAANGLKLAGLSASKARHVDKIDFQKTVSRYRGAEIMPGLFLDVVHISKHMGRGADELTLGIYRLVCANGLIVGETFLKTRLTHIGNTAENLDKAIKVTLSKRDELVAMVHKMQSTIATPELQRQLTEAATRLLVPNTAVNVRSSLNAIRRDADYNDTLWNVFNRIQESATLGRGVSYSVESLNKQGRLYLRNMTVRPIKPNTQKDLTFNSALFDLAVKFAA